MFVPCRCAALPFFAAGICSYLFLYFMNFGMDLIDVALKRRTLDAVMYDNCPDAFQVCVSGVLSGGRVQGAVWRAAGSAADFFVARCRSLSAELKRLLEEMLERQAGVVAGPCCIALAVNACALLSGAAWVCAAGHDKEARALQEPLSCVAGACQPRARSPLCSCQCKQRC